MCLVSCTAANVPLRVPMFYHKFHLPCPNVLFCPIFHVSLNVPLRVPFSMSQWPITFPFFIHQCRTLSHFPCPITCPIFHVQMSYYILIFHSPMSHFVSFSLSQCRILSNFPCPITHPIFHVPMSHFPCPNLYVFKRIFVILSLNLPDYFTKKNTSGRGFDFSSLKALSSFFESGFLNARLSSACSTDYERAKREGYICMYSS